MRIRNTLLSLAFGLASLAPARADTLATIVTAASERAPAFALGAAISSTASPPEMIVTGPIRKGSDTPVSPDAPWHIGSITKAFTATLVLRMAARAQLSLDAPIATYLPNADLHPDWAAITLRQLLSHTAGLPPNASMAQFRKRDGTDLHMIRQEVLAANWTSPLPGTPDTYTYSNLGYVLAGYIAEAVTGQSWEDLIIAHIAGPLGLTSLGFGAPTSAGAAWGHRDFVVMKRAMDPTKTAADNPPWMGPAGRIHLSLPDLMRWGQAHLRACAGDLPDFLSAADCETLQTVVQDNYGLGWVIEESNGAPAIWHNGSNTMWYAVLMLQPDRNRVIAVTTNVFDAPRIDAIVTDLRALP